MKWKGKRFWSCKFWQGLSFFDKTGAFSTIEIVLKLLAFGIEATGRRNLALNIFDIALTGMKKSGRNRRDATNLVAKRRNISHQMVAISRKKASLIRSG